MTDDRRHLQILSILHYVFAGLLTLGGCFPITYVVFGVLMLTGAIEPEEDPEAMRVMGLIFTIVGLAVIAVSWVLAVLTFLAGRRLATPRNHRYCLVIAAIECIFLPLGTALGVFTLVVLTRESVKALFGGSVPAGDANAPFGMTPADSR